MLSLRLNLTKGNKTIVLALAQEGVDVVDAIGRSHLLGTTFEGFSPLSASLPVSPSQRCAKDDPPARWNCGTSSAKRYGVCRALHGSSQALSLDWATEGLLERIAAPYSEIIKDQNRPNEALLAVAARLREMRDCQQPGLPATDKTAHPAPWAKK